MATGKEKESRGASMVEKHLQKLQKEKEEAAKVKLHSLMPQFGQLVRITALERTDWNPEKASLLLRRFQVANASRLHQLHKKRKRILSSLAKSTMTVEQEKLPDSGLDSVKSSPFSDGRSDKSSRRRREKKKSRHRSKKHGSEKKRKESKGSHTTSFGKYGIIREADRDWKRAEFCKWALEVKHIDTEILSKTEEIRLFADFIEDFNTGSLPHQKYYDLKLYEAKKQAERERRKKPTDEEYTFNDEEERRRELETKRVEDHKKRVQEAYFELRTSEKATDMREQEMLRLQMKLAYKTGDTKTAEKIAERLKPNIKKSNNSEYDNKQQ